MVVRRHAIAVGATTVRVGLAYLALFGSFLARFKVTGSWARSRWAGGVVGCPKKAWSMSDSGGQRADWGRKRRGKGEEREKKEKGKEKEKWERKKYLSSSFGFAKLECTLFLNFSNLNFVFA